MFQIMDIEDTYSNPKKTLLAGPTLFILEGKVNETVQLQSCRTADFSTEVHVKNVFGSSMSDIDREYECRGAKDMHYRIHAPNAGIKVFKTTTYTSRDGSVA